MCFLLYAGTNSPLARKKWRQDGRALSVESLTDWDAAIKAHFTKPEVQYIGSTSGCGCDFPHAALQNGDWPEIGYQEGQDARYPETVASDQFNREALVDFLRKTGERVVELYGIEEGDYTEAPTAQESIAVERILDPDFLFKERGFYRVAIEGASPASKIHRPAEPQLP